MFPKTDRDSPRDLDALIETALADQRCRPVPVGLPRTVQNRVRIVAFTAQERQRLRRGLLGFLASCMLLVLASGAGLWVASSSPRVGHAFPGIAGFLDYVVSAPTLSYWAVPALVIITFFGAAIGLFLYLAAFYEQ